MSDIDDILSDLDMMSDKGQVGIIGNEDLKILLDQIKYWKSWVPHDEIHSGNEGDI